MNEECKWVIELVADWAAIIIAVSALLFAIYEGREIRKHNRLSVKPVIFARRILSSLGKTSGLFFQNGGLGPGNVRNIQLSMGEQKPMPLTSRTDLQTFMHEHLKVANVNYKLFVPSPSYYIKPGESLGIIEFHNQTIDVDAFPELMSFLGNLRITFDYSSLYFEPSSGDKENWSYDSIKHYQPVSD